MPERGVVTGDRKGGPLRGCALLVGDEVLPRGLPVPMGGW